MFDVMAWLVGAFFFCLFSWIGLQLMIFLAYLKELNEILVYGVMESLDLLQQGRVDEARETLEEHLSQTVQCSEKYYAKHGFFSKKPVKLNNG